MHVMDLLNGFDSNGDIQDKAKKLALHIASCALALGPST